MAIARKPELLTLRVLVTFQVAPGTCCGRHGAPEQSGTTKHITVIVPHVPRDGIEFAKIDAIVSAEGAMVEGREIRAGCEYGAIVGDGTAYIQAITRE